MPRDLAGEELDDLLLGISGRLRELKDLLAHETQRANLLEDEVRVQTERARFLEKDNYVIHSRKIFSRYRNRLGRLRVALHAAGVPEHIVYEIEHGRPAPHGRFQ